MAHKYQSDMTILDCSCPPVEASSIERHVWRFCFDAEVCSLGSFVPPAKMDPKRKFKSAPERCDAFGLSLFMSESEARAFWRERMDAHPKFSRNVGDFLAEGNVGPVDGLATTPDTAGHFSFFEAEHVALHVVFRVVGALS